MFDAPMRDLCEVKRNRTSTPLQALNLLNDPQVLEASRALAQQLIQNQSLQDPDAKIAYAFQRIVGRKSTRDESRILTGLYREELDRYRKQPKLAGQFLAVGRYPLLEQADQADVAALMLAISTIFNMDEALSKV
jgi:hypothetical protein